MTRCCGISWRWQPRGKARAPLRQRGLARALPLATVLMVAPPLRAAVTLHPSQATASAVQVAQAESYTPVNKPGFIKRRVKVKDEQGQHFRLRKGERVLVLYERGSWYWVKSKGGRQGWVKKRFVRLKPLRGKRRPVPPEQAGPAVPVEPPAPPGGGDQDEPAADAADAAPQGAAEAAASTAEPASGQVGTGAPGAPQQEEPDALAVGVATQTPQKILVMDLVAAGVSPSLATQTTSLLAQAIADHPGASALTMQDLEDVVSHEESQQLSGCQAQASCAAELGARGAADLVISGTLGMVGTSLTLSLALIDARAVVVRERVSQVVLNSEQLAQHTRQAVTELMGWGEGGATVAFHLPDSAEPSFAVFDLAPSGVEAATVTNLTQILSAELKKIEGARVIGRDDIQAMLDLEANKQMLGCADDTSCLAEIGAALGVQFLVAGHVGRIAETYLVSLRLIDPGSVAVANRITESFVGPEDQLVGAVRHSTRRLLGIDTARPGVLVLSANEMDGEVFVDGESRGTLPLEPIAGLAPGRHSLRVVKEDFLEHSGDFYVDPDGRTELVVELVERPRAWYQSWIFWTSATAVVVAGAVGGGVIWALQSEANRTYPLSMEVGLPAR